MMRMHINGHDVPLEVEDVDIVADERSTVSNPPPEPTEPVTFEATATLTGEQAEELRAWLDGDSHLPTLNICANVHGGRLTTEFEAAQAFCLQAYPERAQALDTTGRVLRMQYERGGDKTAWDPGSVDVGFCVEVGEK